MIINYHTAISLITLCYHAVLYLRPDLLRTTVAVHSMTVEFTPNSAGGFSGSPKQQQQWQYWRRQQQEKKKQKKDEGTKNDNKKENTKEKQNETKKENKH